jgi:hypothetical protein
MLKISLDLTLQDSEAGLRDFLALHKSLELTADVIFVNGYPFLLTRYRGVQLITIEIEYLPRRTAKVIGKHLTRVLQMYARSGF